MATLLDTNISATLMPKGIYTYHAPSPACRCCITPMPDHLGRFQCQSGCPATRSDRDARQVLQTIHHQSPVLPAYVVCGLGMATEARSDLDARGGGTLDSSSSDVLKAAVARAHQRHRKRRGRDQAETCRGQAEFQCCWRGNACDHTAGG